MKKNNIFWVGYSDLMTSMFFVMLVLFVVTISYLKIKETGYIDDAEKYRKIQEIEKAVQELDSTYFTFDYASKRYKMNIDVNFLGGKCNIPSKYNEDLKKAGSLLYNKMLELKTRDESVNYLLIIEGNTARAIYKGEWNYKYSADVGYVLSYKRALALYNYWKDCGFDFREFEHCEVLITGSGYFGKSREKRESKNRRFTIQITPKIGKF